MAIPLLIVGDAPYRPTGLSRILTDLVTRVVEELPEFEVGVVGYQPWGGLPTCGIPVTGGGWNWRQWAFADLTHHGAEAVQTAYRAWFGDRPGVLLSIWDPGRCHAFTQLDLPIEKWGYFAVDAANMNGGISGPAGAAVNGYDRVLAYTQFGKRVLETATDLPVEVLPHGIDLSVFTRLMTAEERAAMITRLFPGGYKEHTLLLGCVATNQPRKDLGLFVQVLRLLRETGMQVDGWLHTDRLVSEAWSIPQLVADAQVTDYLTVTTAMTDRELAVAYSLCSLTIAPGRGEGFGYPIVESLACGVPVLHADHGGGAEFVPVGGLIPPVTHHLVGPYALARPILAPSAVTIRAKQVLSMDFDPGFLRTTVEHLGWPTLWPAWAAWFQRGAMAFDQQQERQHV